MTKLWVFLKQTQELQYRTRVNSVYGGREKLRKPKKKKKKQSEGKAKTLEDWTIGNIKDFFE